jgi:predicted LPLAT superfamily acyltransferase
MTETKSAAVTSSLSAPRWRDLPERGAPQMLRAYHWIALRIGRPIARTLLYPVTLYFVLCAGKLRSASYDYLRRILPHRVHWWNVFRHFYFFAATILDRVYLLRGQFDHFKVRLHGIDVLHQAIGMGKGCILLGSHLGSFEVLRTLGVTRNLRLRVLMDVEHNENITQLLDSLNPEIASTVIVPDRSDTLLRVKESLDAGFVVGTLGDRVTKNDKTASCQFLHAPATFPAGAFIIAAVMHCPIVLFFGLYRGGNRYDIHFEQFTEEVLLDRERRTDELQRWVQRYVDRLEHYCRLAPYNWFNFYPFWD